MFYSTISKKTKALTKKFASISFLKKRWVFFIVASIVVCVFWWPVLGTGNQNIGGDFDYYAQMYQAFRISILHYHQFPSWNPWMSGGLPLFNNPQFGLVSIQSILVIPFGAIYGLKLAYVIYALAGFWGMYVMCREIISASKLRSLLVSYIWIFCGFFSSHHISHFTFALFYLLPWLLYFVAKRETQKYSWLWLGILESLIILSSVHYALLMTGLVVVIYFGLSFLIRPTNVKMGLLERIKVDGLYAAKVVGVVAVLGGYRLFSTYSFVSTNQKIPALLYDKSNPPDQLFQAIFLPVGTLLKVPAHLEWSWGEYSMYIGVGTGLALLFVLCSIIISLVRKKSIKLNAANFVVCMLIMGLISAAFALGDFGPHSPFQLLRHFPGFDQTRVSARWLFFSTFSILVLLAAWPKNKVIVNVLLILGMIELFITYVPHTPITSVLFTLPKATFSNTFSQYDNGRQHLDAGINVMHSYYYSTSSNVGQIYSDDSLMDTLDKVYGTDKCGLNVNPSCTFVLSQNAKVQYWSPNTIKLTRTAPGNIVLNMNVEKGWRINNVYPFMGYKSLNPENAFVLGGNNKQYILQYAPKYSPSWVAWRIHKL